MSNIYDFKTKKRIHNQPSAFTSEEKLLVYSTLIARQISSGFSFPLEAIFGVSEEGDGWGYVESRVDNKWEQSDYAILRMEKSMLTLERQANGGIVDPETTKPEINLLVYKSCHSSWGTTDGADVKYAKNYCAYRGDNLFDLIELRQTPDVFAITKSVFDRHRRDVHSHVDAIESNRLIIAIDNREYGVYQGWDWNHIHLLNTAVQTKAREALVAAAAVGQAQQGVNDGRL